MLAEQQQRLLLVQLARGPFANFWLLPSTIVEQVGLAKCAVDMLRTHTGYSVCEQELISVLEEPLVGGLTMRMVFRASVNEQASSIIDPDIAQARWFSREAIVQLLQEREVVPRLGILSLLRAWAEQIPLRPLETLVDNALCPCGSGFQFRGCCGWDAKT